MKKHLLIALFLLSNIVNSNAQHILGLYIEPANPTTNDTIQAFASLEFSSATCNEKTQNLMQTGNTMYGYALHCVGMLQYICNATDTFVINPLSAGNYKFIYGVDEGGLPSPCTPGIVAGPVDTIDFTVTLATTIHSVASFPLVIYPNPTGDFLMIDLGISGYDYSEINIYNVFGSLFASQKHFQNKSVINVSNLPDGIYFLKIDSGSSSVVRRILKMK